MMEGLLDLRFTTGKKPWTKIGDPFRGEIVVRVIISVERMATFNYLASYPSTPWLRWSCGRCSGDVSPGGKHLQKIPVIHIAFRVLGKHIPNMTELIAGHTERMFVEYFVKRVSVDSSSMVSVFIRECLEQYRKYELPNASFILN